MARMRPGIGTVERHQELLGRSPLPSDPNAVRPMGERVCTITATMSAKPREAEAKYARSWFKNIMSDIFG